MKVEGKNGIYYGGGITDEEIVAYYREVIRLLTGRRKGDTFDEEMSMQELRIMIDDLIY